MKVNEFIEEFKNATNKEECVKKHIVNTYIPYEKKIALCKNVVLSTTHIQDRYVVNTPLQSVFFALTLVDTYTDIEIEFDDTLMNSFDLLDSNDLIDIIIRNISPIEYRKMNSMLQMIGDDVYQNERNLLDFIDNKLTAIQVTFDMLSKNMDKLTGLDLNEQNSVRQTTTKNKSSK